MCLLLFSLPPLLAQHQPAQLNADPSNYATILPTLQAGDTLTLAGGSYPFLNVNGLTGTPQAWITITGPASGPPAIIYAPSACCNTVQITNSSYVAIKNLTVDSKSLPYIDGINSHNGTNNLTHDILIEGNTLINQNANQQTCGISTKTPTWGWIIRNNVINGAGTGIYLGNSDGTDPFVGGIIENNLVENTIGYDAQVKYQTPRPTVPGMPTGQSITIIRNNVFIKNDQVSPDGDRPNLLVGSFPSTGAGSTDMYEIYGNFLYHNPRESLLQVEGRVSVHDNVFVDANFAAINLEGIDGPLQIAYVYNNTVYTQTRGFYFGRNPTVDGSVNGNLIFAATPLTGTVSTSNNIIDTFANASHYVNAPSLTLGSMNFFPLAGQASGTPLDLSKFTSDPDYSIDFNGNPKGSPAIYRGAYAGSGTNPGWQLQAGVKPSATIPGATLSSIACQPGTISSGNSSQCTVTLIGPANGDIAVSLSSSSAALAVPATVTVLNGMTSGSFSATAAAVALSQTASVTATMEGASVSQMLTINPLPGVAAVTSLTCAPGTIAAGASANCTAALSVAPLSNATVMVSTGSSLLQVPATAVAAAGMLSATFTVTAGTVPATQSVTVTATLNGTSATFTLTLQAPTAFYLQGNHADMPSLVNGATVTPEIHPVGLTGNVVVRGSGSVAYSPLPNGDGLSFAKSGDQNINTAFLSFSGTPVSSLFNVSQGDLTFFVKSNLSFASRSSSLPSEYIFAADDGHQILFDFLVGAPSSRLVFYVLVGGAANSYFVPAGQENAVFGNGVVAKFRLTWNGSQAVLYLNDTNVLAFSYTPVTPSWSPAASFTIGADSVNQFGGGYYSAADSVADVLFVGGSGVSTPTSLLSEIGVYRPLAPGGNAPMTFYLDSDANNTWDAGDKVRGFGLSGLPGTTQIDVPVAGDWDGTSVVRFGVFRCPTIGQPGTCNWYIDLNNSGGWDGTSAGDAVWSFGLPGDLPVVGDWTGDGKAKIGVIRCPAVGQPGECAWILDLGNKHTYDPGTAGIYNFGLAGDRPAVANWKGGASDQVGVYRPATGQWIVDSVGNTGGTNVEVYSPADAVFTFNAPGGFMAGDVPVVGNWNGNGKKRVGIFRSSSGQWYVDTNGNGVYDAGDQIFAFGLPPSGNPGAVPDQPVVGFWTMQ